MDTCGLAALFWDRQQQETAFLMKAPLKELYPSPDSVWTYSTLQMDLPLRDAHYIRTSVCSTVVEGDCVCIMGAWDMRTKVNKNEAYRRVRTESVA